MNIRISLEYPIKRIILRPENQGDRLILQKAMDEADRGGILHGDELDIDNVFLGHWFTLKQKSPESA